MRHSVIALALFFLAIPVLAQYGNEWINFNQAYFKIPVAKEGLYKLDYSSLVAAGFPSSIDPKTIKLFHRGVEQAIYIDGESDGVLNSSDFIEFYGRKNDGVQDAELYKDPSAQPHRLYNLYTDTTSYFLTFGVGAGKRMILQSEPNSGLTPQAFHSEKKLIVLKDQYSGGIDYGDIKNTFFDTGEGWMGNQILQNQTGNYLIQDITNTVPSAGQPQLELLLTGRGQMSHVVEVYAGSRLLTTLNFLGYQSYKHVQSLEWSDIVSGNLTLAVKVVGAGGKPDRVSVGYIGVRYPQQLDMDNTASKLFTLAENAGGKSYVEITDPSPGTRLFDVTDPSNVSRINTTLASTLNAIVTSTESARKIQAISTTITPSMKRVFFRSINPAAHNYIIITHPSLRKPASGYTDPVKAYGEYRALPQGGGYDTLIVNIQDLYNQFNYGEQSPLAIFHFMKFLASIKLPDYLFLIGKGLDVDYSYYRNTSTFTTYKDLVPTAGYPPSDMAFTAGLSGIPYAPAVSTGRLTAIGPQDVAAYLDKVKELESLPFNDLRRKNILHLSGGIYEGEPQLFRSYLKQFATVAETFHLGGYVKSIAKQSTDIEVINVAEEVNEGLGLITFFGHSAPTSTDFDIGNVTDPVLGYNNKGKYPVLLMNGCSSGSFFLNATIFGENWINTPNRGALGVIAHSSFGFASTLRNYSSLFYNIGYGDSLFINKGVGDVQKEVAKRYLNTYGTSPVGITQVQQMVLLGDPAVKLFGAIKPDYEIRKENISLESFTGEPITALMDSLKLNFVVRNFGNAQNKNFKIEVTRTLNDNSTLVYDSIFKPVLYSDTLTFIIPGKDNGFGNNIFTVKIDTDNLIDELREDNNSAIYEYFIPLSRSKNLYPDNYAIINTTQLNLSLQHTDMLSDEREFLLELDTTDAFNSPFKKSFLIKGTVLATQPIDLLTSDTLAYYWRTKLANPAQNESVDWDVSSFTYINNGPEGWAQVHFPQYEVNPTVGLVNDPELRKIKFEETITDIAIKTFGAAAGKPVDSVSFKIKGAEYVTFTEAPCRNNTINLIAFDKKTTQPYVGIYFTWIDILYTYGGRRLICGREPYVINSFTYDELAMGNGGDIIQYVDNILAGDSVVLFNIGDAGYANWPLAAKNKLGELGISVAQLDNLQPGEPVVIFARKGSSPGMAKIFRPSAGPVNEQNLKITGTMTGRFTSGIMTSPIIGPAQRWDKFLVHYSEKEPNDEILFDITGIKLNGDQVLLETNLTDDEDISTINAKDYPYLKVSFKPTDNTFVTAPQLNKWLVTYEPVAEGLLLYRGAPENQTLFEGQQWNGEYSFVNISNHDFQDSLTVRYDIVNPETFVATRKLLKIDAPQPGDTTRFTASFSTVSQDGVNNIEVFVNPRILSEQNYENNIILLPDHLTVLADGLDPVLDVTFDSRHIAQDEFISPDPEIHIVLWDENQYLLKKDTLGIKLLLAYPCNDDDCELQAIYFSNPDVEWVAATDTTEFYIEFKPGNLSDGRYKLRVEARDANDNASGALPYEITFQVKHETTIAVSQPYPNPFSYKTNFEFALTGENLPRYFNLQILSLSGDLVQSFTEDDISSFYIGTNLLSWSAMDDQGNPLPNGIYVFRFSIKAGDQFVQKSGKIVLVR